MELPNDLSSIEKQELMQPSNDEQNISRIAKQLVFGCISTGLSMALLLLIVLMEHLASNRQTPKGPCSYILPLNSIQIGVLVGFFMVYTLSTLPVLLIARYGGFYKVRISLTALKVAFRCIEMTHLMMWLTLLLALIQHLASKGCHKIAILLSFFLVLTLTLLFCLFKKNVRSKLSRPLAWMRKRRNPVILPPETLIHILHYFPRRQLVKRYSRVNSTFFRTANSLPNLHLISDDTIRFLPQVEYSSNPVDNELKTQSFQWIVLLQYIPRKGLFNGRIERMMERITFRPQRFIDANELVKTMPRWYVRFPEFAIRGIPDEALLQFLRQTKQNFSNCRVIFSANTAVEMEFVEKPQELLTDIFLDAREIDLKISNVALEKFLKLNGVRNCDKVSMHVYYNPSFPRDPPTSQSTDAFIEWLEWKQHDPASRRHLVLFIFDLYRVRELVDGLKQTFKTATKPLNYVVTFLDVKTEVWMSCAGLEEFELENDATGERLSLFHNKKTSSLRLWRRIVTPDDSAWLAALTSIQSTPLRTNSKVMVYTGEIPNTEGIDKTFYDYRDRISIPVYRL